MCVANAEVGKCKAQWVGRARESSEQKDPASILNIPNVRRKVRDPDVDHVTDQATFAYLADVFVLPQYRGRGYGRAIVEALMADPRLQGLRRWHLVTRDKQPLYAKLGFTPLSQPERHMQKHAPDVYRLPLRE